MAPVDGLHRTRGRFSGEAEHVAVTMPGPVARLLPLFVAALGGLSLGLVVGASANGKRPPG